MGKVPGNRGAEGLGRGRNTSRGVWSRSATGQQIKVLKATGSYDGKYYSQGRASQSLRASSTPRRQPHSRVIPVIGPVANTTLLIGATDLPAYINLPEGDPMSELALGPATQDITKVVALSATAEGQAVPFGFLEELERAHLSGLAKRSGATDPAQVRALETGWAVTKVKMATLFARARSEIIEILEGAPTGTIAAPAAAAQEILWNASSASLEKTLLDAVHGASKDSEPSRVLDEVLAQVQHRIDLAMIYAHGRVNLELERSRPLAKTTKPPAPIWGEVTAVKPFGAFVRLPSGEEGLLHVSELRRLRNGAFVKDASDVVFAGQAILVRQASRTADDKIGLALVSVD